MTTVTAGIAGPSGNPDLLTGDVLPDPTAKFVEFFGPPKMKVERNPLDRWSRETFSLPEVRSPSLLPRGDPVRGSC